MLMELVEIHGVNNWTKVAQMLGKTAKQCSQRWHNNLNPLIKRTNWTKEEEWALFLLHSLCGSRWS